MLLWKVTKCVLFARPANSVAESDLLSASSVDQMLFLVMISVVVYVKKVFGQILLNWDAKNVIMVQHAVFVKV